MEQNTNSAEEQITEQDLREAGASASYIAYYQAAERMGESTPSTTHAKMTVNHGISADSGGSFHKSLWHNEPRGNSSNPYGADSRNMRILTEAGVSPYKKIAP